MAFYKVTHSEKYRRATVYNWGCNFRCLGCAYKARDLKAPDTLPTLDQIKSVLRQLDVDAVHFMGGEPTTCRDLPELLAFCKHELGVSTWLGHTNGSHLVTENVDRSNVGFKAFDPGLHIEYTGHPKEAVYDNFRRAYEAGVRLRGNAIFIPDFGGLPDLLNIARFVASVDPEIPFHVNGYIPTPELNWRSPTPEEMEEALGAVRSYLPHVTSSLLTVEQARDPRLRGDDRFIVRQVL